MCCSAARLQTEGGREDGEERTEGKGEGGGWGGEGEGGGKAEGNSATEYSLLTLEDVRLTIQDMQSYNKASVTSVVAQ